MYSETLPRTFRETDRSHCTYPDLHRCCHRSRCRRHTHSVHVCKSQKYTPSNLRRNLRLNTRTSDVTNVVIRDSEFFSNVNKTAPSETKTKRTSTHHDQDQQEAQLMLTNPRDAFRGQSRSPNIASYHMLGILSSCAIVTMTLRRAVYLTFDVKNVVTLKSWLEVIQGH